MISQDEWREEVIRDSIAMVEKAQPELIAIVENAVRQRGLLLIDNPATVMQFAHVINQVQDESFQLGLRLGMQTVVDVLSKQKPKENEAGKL